MLSAGWVFAGYRIERLLGAGGAVDILNAIAAKIPH